MAKDLKDKMPAQIEEIVTAAGQKKHHAGTIFSFIHSKGIGDISRISPLTKAFRAQLTGQGWFISKLDLTRKLTDPDGTTKYTFTLADGNAIESVLLIDRRRRTLCISTQAGCAMNCVFCATGKLQLTCNLTAAEIVDQVYAVEKQDRPITNVVYMGMGEPLANYDAVLRSVRILNHPQGRNIGIRRLAVSTCGLAPAIKKLAGEDIRPRLAISLNAPTDDLRTKLMPVNAKYPLKVLLDAIRTYQLRTKERVTFEYVMIEGINDSLSHAGQLVKLLRRFNCNLNLIEYNPHPRCKFKAGDPVKIQRFAEVTTQAGIETTIRFKQGADIFAACGQLGAEGPK